MKNDKLYKESNEIAISKDMKKLRWRAFGHFLRLHENTPCNQAMKYYFEKPEISKRYPGSKRINLPIVLDNDIKQCNKKFNLPITKFENTENLKSITKLAADRNYWRTLCEMICDDTVQDEE